MKTFRLPHFSTWLGIIVLTAILVGDRILITPSFHEPVSYTVPKTADLLMPAPLQVGYHIYQLVTLKNL
jgi:hypothetical protein